MITKTTRMGHVFRMLALALSNIGCLSAQIPAADMEPLPITQDSYPFGAANQSLKYQDLSQYGYVEEELFARGKANVYDWPENSAALKRTPDAPYTTRVLVRRPASAGRFSGNVIIEMLNPSNLFDLNIGWAISHQQILRHGDAWVGITAKPISVVALKRFNPERYAALSWANPLPASDPRNCDMARSRDSTQDTENGLVWDIHRQVAMWLNSDAASNPFTYGQGNSQVEHLYGWGYSQTGGFLYTYINAIHPLDVAALGRPLFDGYIVGVASGPTPINQCAERLPTGDERLFLRNVGVPVMRIMSQSDYLSGIAARRADGDSPRDPYRNYEIAGSAHATPDELYYAAKPADIEKAGVAVPAMACNEGTRSRFPNSLAFNAALANLDLWVRQGTPAPRAENILVENGEPVLDEFGNVKGGIRSPYVDVPTAQWTGRSTGASFCFIAGHEVPFDTTRLSALYPTHESYVQAVRENVNDLVEQRFIVREDGDMLIREAEQVELP